MPANKVTADTVKQETPEERQERFKTKWGITNWDDLYDDSEDDLNEAVESESDNAIKQQAQQWPQNSNLNASITQLIKHPFTKRRFKIWRGKKGKSRPQKTDADLA